MTNMRIIAKNIAPDASIAASPSLTFPESNLLLPLERGRVARTNGLASQAITLSWSSSQKAMAVAVCRHNLTTSGTIRNAFSNSVPAVIQDAGALAAFSTSGLDTDITDYTAATFRGKKNTVEYFSEITTARSLVHTWSDAANPDGYMEATKLFVGRYFEITYNPGAVEFNPGDTSAIGRADDGTAIVNAGYKARSILINLEAIPNDTDLKTLLAIADHLGQGGQCFIDLYPDRTDAMGVYGRGCFFLRDSPTFNHAQYGIHKNTMRFEEA